MYGNKLTPLGSAAQARQDSIAQTRRRFDDIGNAQKLADFGEGNIIYVKGLGWLCYDQKRWSPDGEDRVLELAKATARYFFEEATKASDAGNEELARLLEGWGKTCGHAVRIDKMIHLAKSNPRLRIPVSRLDGGDVLNVQNGILDLGTLEMREHDPVALLTKITNGAYRAGARCPKFESTVEYFLPDPEIRAWFQMAMGYSMRGAFSRYLFIPWGSGQNGKSTIMHAVRHALGDYARVGERDMLIQKRGASGGDVAQPSLAATRGVRLLITVETEEGKALADGLVKQLTGEGIITARHLYKDSIEFKNQAAVWLATNHKPHVQGDDEAMWDRLRLIPFTVRIADKDKRDHEEVLAELEAEADGILGWLVEGLRMYRAQGSLDPVPDAIKAAGAGYREEMDALAEWLDACVVFEASAIEPVADVRKSYDQHCAENNRRPLGATRFNDALRKREVEQEAPYSPILKKTVKSWRGLRLTDDPSPSSPA